MFDQTPPQPSKPSMPPAGGPPTPPSAPPSRPPVTPVGSSVPPKPPVPLAPPPKPPASLAAPPVPPKLVGSAPFAAPTRVSVPPLQPKPLTPPPAKIEIPSGAAKPKTETEPSVHVMPGEYYGIAPKTPVKKVEMVQPLAPPKLPPPPPQKLSSPSMGEGKGEGVKSKKKKIPVVLIIGIAFLAVIGLGGFLFLRSLEPPPKPVANVAPLPPPPPPPPAAVCGNSRCESGETTASCATDCPAPPPPPPAPIRPGTDTDSDGLTDIEESAIYNSNSRNPDTDGDTFIDGNEVFNLYDPTAGMNAVLHDEKKICAFEPPQRPYSLFIPCGWTLEQIPSESLIEFRSSTGEIIGINTFEIINDQTLEQWYDENVSGGSISGGTASSFQPKNSLMQGLKSAERTTVYLMLKRNISGYNKNEKHYIYELYYNFGTQRTIEFLRTFEMIVNSFNGS